MQVRSRLAQAELHVAELVAGTLKLGRETLERRDRALCDRNEAGRSIAVLRRQGGRGRGRRLGELGHVPEALALRAQPLLAVRLHSFRVLGESAQLCEARRGPFGVQGELLVASPRREQLAPRDARLRAPGELLLAAEAVEHLELVGRPRQAPLLELAG